MAPSPDDGLLAERTLWQIWIKSRRLRQSKFNKISMIVIVISLSASAFATKQSPREIADMVRKWAELGLSFAASILGFSRRWLHDLRNADETESFSEYGQNQGRP